MNQPGNITKTTLQHRTGNRPGRKTGSGSLKIDMTPMVDLGFLLITFFVMTAELTKPTALNLVMPAEGESTQIGESMVLTLLLDKANRICYYEGKWEDALSHDLIGTANFTATALRRIIFSKIASLDAAGKSKKSRDEIMVLIKPSREADYKNVVDALDEVTIGMIKKYAVLKISKAEANWLNSHLNN